MAEEEGDSVEGQAMGRFLFFLLTFTALLLGRLASRWRYATEASVASLLGLVGGGVALALGASEALKFNADVFFNICLPPIIFNAGWSLKAKQFFQNWGLISSLGVAGTVASFFALTCGFRYALPALGLPLALGDAMALGAVFSSTDSVSALQVLSKDDTPGLFSVVFGEGVLNDATTIVLLSSIRSIAVGEVVTWGAMPRLVLEFLTLFATSLGLGVGTGLLCALVVRHLQHAGQDRHPDLELLVCGCLALCVYLLSEALDLSGIVSCFFCGVACSHWAYYSLAPETRAAATPTFQAASTLLETVVFAYTGLDVWDPSLWRHSAPGEAAWLALAMWLLTALARAAFVAPVVLALGGGRGRARVPWAAVWWSGLMRGALSVALAMNWFAAFRQDLRDPRHSTVLASVYLVVLVSSLVAGACNKSVLPLLLGEGGRGGGREGGLLPDGPGSEGGGGSDTDPDSDEEEPPPPRARGLHRMWQVLDRQYLQPVFGGRWVDEAGRRSSPVADI